MEFITYVNQIEITFEVEGMFLKYFVQSKDKELHADRLAWWCFNIQGEI